VRPWIADHWPQGRTLGRIRRGQGCWLEIWTIGGGYRLAK
jgi:hypothetical protein